MPAAIQCRLAVRNRTPPEPRLLSRRHCFRRPSATCSIRSGWPRASARSSGSRRPRGPEEAPRRRLRERRLQVGEASESEPRFHHAHARGAVQAKRFRLDRRSTVPALSPAGTWSAGNTIRGTNGRPTRSKPVWHRSRTSIRPTVGQHAALPVGTTSPPDRTPMATAAHRFPRIHAGFAVVGGSAPFLLSQRRREEMPVESPPVQPGARCLFRLHPDARASGTDSWSSRGNPPATVMDRRGETARKAAVAQRSRLHR